MNHVLETLSATTMREPSANLQLLLQLLRSLPQVALVVEVIDLRGRCTQDGFKLGVVADRLHLGGLLLLGRAEAGIIDDLDGRAVDQVSTIRPACANERMQIC